MLEHSYKRNCRSPFSLRRILMKIFVGYGYNERDQWVENCVFPIIEAFGSEAISGKEIYGENISEGVRKKIKESDALIGFLTKREDGTTHRWVSDELAVAIEHNIRILEVREVGITDQGGIAGERQRIPYDDKHRDMVLIELVKAIGLWHRIVTVEMQLLPRQFVDEVRQLLDHSSFHCTYNLWEGRNEQKDIKAEIKPKIGGLFIILKDIPLKAYVQVRVVVRDSIWESDFEQIEQQRIQLNKKEK
jgi:hypothetical protein